MDVLHRKATGLEAEGPPPSCCCKRAADALRAVRPTEIVQNSCAALRNFFAQAGEALAFSWGPDMYVTAGENKEK